MANWKDKFISRFIDDNIILSPSDHSKYKGYIYNLNEDNLENNMHARNFRL